MEEMPLDLFLYLSEYIKFFAHPEMQKYVWDKPEMQKSVLDKPEEEASCEDWIFGALIEWQLQKENLQVSCPSLKKLIQKIDELQKHLKAYLKKIPLFEEKCLRELHAKIMADDNWKKIQEDSATIFQEAIKMLDL